MVVLRDKMVDVGFDGSDRWKIPDDRQLALRGRLETGWSSYRGNVFNHTKENLLSHDEQDAVVHVLQRQEQMQHQEQERIGLLVKKLEQMKKNVFGDGVLTCLVCGTKAGFKDTLHLCVKCGKKVCSKCSIESKFSHDRGPKSFYCVLCNEEQQLWKRSGAWFYNSMPKYVVPDVDIPYGRTGTQRSHADSIKSVGSGSYRRYGTRNGSLQESIDDASDDSDIEETSSVKAFDIPFNRGGGWQGEIDVDDGTFRQRSSNNVSHYKPLARVSQEDALSINEEEMTAGNDADSLYSSQSTLSQYQEENGRGHKPPRKISDTSISSTDTRERKPTHGLRKVFRKPSRDLNVDKHSPSSHRAASPSLSRHEESRSNGHLNSDGSTGSAQDIDAMFKSYESEMANNNKKEEYHGKYGMIEFTLQYDTATQELLVIVHNCKGLKCQSKSKAPDSYVKTSILPEEAKASKKRTSNVKKTHDPVYNESLIYHGISQQDISAKGLRLSVMDETKVGKHYLIGETCIPLKNLATRPMQQFRRILDARSNVESLHLDTKSVTSNPGRIEMALHYLSKQEKLVVGIIRCVGLKALDPNGYSDPYVKCYLLPDPSKKSKQKTAVRKKTLTPEFNEEFSYSIPHNELAKRTLHISVWDYDVGRSNDFIGGVTLGIDASGDALKHWFETLKTSDRRVVRWHTLSEDCPIIE